MLLEKSPKTARTRNLSQQLVVWLLILLLTLLASRWASKNIEILTPQRSKIMVCSNCGSSNFVLIHLIEQNITKFDENSKPLVYDEEEVLKAEIKCDSCRTPLSTLKRK